MSVVKKLKDKNGTLHDIGASWTNVTGKPDTFTPAAHTHTSSDVTGLASVATSGSYNDLSDQPTIPPEITVDSSMSSTSTNPVQNKVVNTALNSKVTKYTFTQPSEYKSFALLEDVTQWYGKTANGSITKGYQLIGQLSYWRSGGGYERMECMFVKFHLNYKWDLSNINCYENESTSPSSNCKLCIIEDARDSELKKYYIALKLPAAWSSTFEFIGRTRDIDLSTITWMEGKSSTSMVPPDGVTIISEPTKISWTVNEATNVSGIVAIANGGTGASTADGARTNLGLGSLATKSSVADSDISGTISDTHIASASAWNSKQNALTQGDNIVINGDTISAIDTTYAETSEADVKAIVSGLT